MATIAQIRADLVGSSAVFRAEMIAGQRQANDSLRAIQSDARATADSIKLLNTAAAGFIGFEGIKTAVSDLLEAQKAVQQIHYTLLSATGSSSAANDAYGQVEETAQRLGLSLQSTALQFSQMSAAATANGVSMKDQMDLFNGVARSSTVLHLSAEQSGSAILALSQMFAKGKIQAQELQLQLGQAIPGVVPRFQQAVLAMTQGTELAGKSFQQLLEQGDLSVTRFLPALVQALNQTGKGAEEAAGGLNAEMNRLSTAWFKLKADLSGGVFGDAAISSIRVLTSNLQGLANVAGVAGGLVASRLAGIGLGKAADGVGAAVAQQQQARAAAQAAAEVADANVAATAAQVKNTEAALAGVTTARQQALAAREAALAVMAKAEAEAAAAQATLAHVQSAATLSANIRAERDAVAQATVAQQNLTRAQQQYDAAIAAGNSFKEQQIALETRLLESRAASTAATEAQVVAERELAATSASGVLTRGIQGAGSFALSLVGGPWGAAVAAIGGFAYAIASAKKASEEYRAETQSQVESLQQLREQLKGATDDYGKLHAARDAQQSLDLYKKGSDDLAKWRAQLADLQQEQANIEASMGAQGGGGMLAGLHLDEVKQRIQALQEQIGPTEQSVDNLSTKLAGSFAPSIDAVKGAIDRLRNGQGLGDVISGWSSDITAGIKAIDLARQQVQTIQSQMQADAQKLTTEAATDGMNNAQKQQYALTQAIAKIKAQRLNPSEESGQIADVTRTAALAIQAGAQKDAADAAKKAAEEAASTAKRWQQQADSLNQSLQQTHNELLAQLDSTTKLTPAQKTLQDILGGTNDAYNHASAALKQKMLAEAQDNAELSKKVALQQQATKDANAFAIVQENLARIAVQSARARQDQLDAIGLGSKDAQDQSAQTSLLRQYDDLMNQAGRSFRHGDISKDEYAKEVAAYKAQLTEELSAEKGFFAQRDAMQADWVNGARSALSNYLDSAANVAAQTSQLFSDAFSGLENALVTFVQSGKLSFTSLANSIIADLARMQIRAAESSIFGYLSNAFMPIMSSSGISANLSSSIAGDISGYKNDLGTFSFGGGRKSGGGVSPNTLYEVAEGGKPELLESGGHTYLMMGAQGGSVTPADAGGGGAIASGNAVGAGVELHIHNGVGAQVSQKQSVGPNGQMRLDVFLKQIDEGLAAMATSGTSKFSRAQATRTGTNLATAI